jgi:mono/diheme cytochrome c family protein
MDELLAKAAEAMGMPEAMVRRSAEARAKAEGRAVEEVLAEWAGVEAPEGAAEEEPDAAAEPAAEAPAPREPGEKPPATGIDLFVEAAAEKMNMPASMIRRSAEARARAEDRSFEEVLADWAGADVDEVRAAAREPDAEPEPEAEARAEVPAEAAEETAEEEPAEEEPAEEEPAEDELEVEVIGAEEAEEGAVEEEPEPEPVGAGAGIPRWLMSILVIVPALAVGYAAFFPNGPNCGDAGRLAVDPVTGLAVECDGSPYGERVADFFAVGSAIYPQCAGCHGTGGGGTPAGPPFEGEVLVTFPEGQCETHVEWVRLGSPGWPDATYGATDKPVGGFGQIMPPFGGTLTEEELRSVVLYERVQFGGQPLQEAIVDCGLVEGEDGDAQAPEPGGEAEAEDGG